jgi:hypothetical protein
MIDRAYIGLELTRYRLSDPKIKGNAIPSYIPDS